MVNYKAIADAIPQAEFDACMVELAKEHIHLDKQGDEQITAGKFMDLTTIFAAFDIIKDNTTEVSKGDICLQSYASLSAIIGFEKTAQFEDGVNAAIADNKMSGWIDQALHGDGININDDELKAKFIVLKDSYGFTPALFTAIADAGKQTVLDFPRLKPGHVQNALQKRHAGVI